MPRQSQLRLAKWSQLNLRGCWQDSEHCTFASTVNGSQNLSTYTYARRYHISHTCKCVVLLGLSWPPIFIHIVRCNAIRQRCHKLTARCWCQKCPGGYRAKWHSRLVYFINWSDMPIRWSMMTYVYAEDVTDSSPIRSVVQLWWISDLVVEPCSHSVDRLF